MKEYTKAKINLIFSIMGLAVIVGLLGSIFLVLSKTLPIIIAILAILAPGALVLVFAACAVKWSHDDFKFRKEVEKDI